MQKVKFKFPSAVFDLSDPHKAELIKSLGEELGLNMRINNSADPIHAALTSAVPNQHTTHDHERTMWTPDAVPIIAELEDWFYSNLTGDTFALYNELLLALGISSWDLMDVHKSFGHEFSTWMDLSKADEGFNLGDIIRINQQNRQKLWQYVADGGAYSKEELARLHEFITARVPNYGPLLEAFAVRGVFLGKLKQAADANSLELLGVLLAQLPVRIEQVSRHSIPFSLRSIGGLMQHIEIPPFTEAEIQAVQYAEQHAARYVTKASEGLKWAIQEDVTHARRNRQDSQALRQTLLDHLGEHNRDWRKIALTELTDVMANGYLASLPMGARVMGQGSANACPHCKSMTIGKAFTKTDGPGDPATDIWVGKSNVGRKTKEWWPTIPMHPHCRCRWVQLADHQDVDAEGKTFIRPLEELIELYKKKGLIHPEYTMDAGAPTST